MKFVSLQIDTGIATVPLNRPERRNALSLELGSCRESAEDACKSLDRKIGKSS